MFEDAALHAMDAQSSHVEEILQFRSIMQLSCSIHIITEVISKINSMIQLMNFVASVIMFLLRPSDSNHQHRQCSTPKDHST